MKTLLLIAMLFVPLASAIPETDDRLREIIAELDANNKVITAEAEGIRGQLAQALEAKAAAQAESKVLAEQATINKASAEGWQAQAAKEEALRKAETERADSWRSEAWWWRAGAVSVGLVVLGYFFGPMLLRLIPL